MNSILVPFYILCRLLDAVPHRPPVQAIHHHPHAHPLQTRVQDYQIFGVRESPLQRNISEVKELVSKVKNKRMNLVHCGTLARTRMPLKK